ncbi:hypothetical protein GGH94_002229 [Coemansia aciculifera]|uniref:Uncharacterized protein n=1 Tax=Coemansia aciculifera TaxID=417176 RepID=A0A9W8IJH4_9FUNG|nr:hypothetical protein GGH94_002229 [Coemansia aciculifera]KAJ2875192.1 hypothetical protein GGH93_001818 [Coemansia aciculifera]
MTIQYLFQSLPMLVTEKIIEYLEGRPRNYYDDDINKHNETKRIIYPLLSVGEVWCEAALISICDNCEVVFNDAGGVFDVNYPTWPAGFSYSQFPRDKLVKRVVLTASGWNDMVNKHNNETIAWSQYNGAIFLSATNLVVKLNKSNSFSHLSAAKLKARSSHEAIDSLARSIRRLTPAVTGVSVVAISVNATHKSHREVCVMLVSELCRGSVTRLDVGFQVDSPMLSLRLYDVSGLASITQGTNVVCCLIARLAYLNAHTLKELHITPSTQDDWAALIKCGSLAPMVYTSLVSLSMDIANTVSANGWTTVEGSVPFPVLVKLAISGAYPFADDTLFRGNRDMLLTLSLPFDAIAKNALGRLGVLKRSGITRMNSIHIVQIPNTYEPTPSDDLVREQMHRILESSTILKLGCDPRYGIPLNRQVFNAL